MIERHAGHSEDITDKGNLTDFFYDVRDDSKLQIEVAVKDDGRCAIFHNKRLKRDLSWLEYNLDSCRLDFVLDNGEVRDAGMPLTKEISKNMQNTHQVLMVLMDDQTGEALRGYYFPLILHRSR